MATPFRPEITDIRKKVRTETDNVLSGVTVSNYAGIERNLSADILSQEGAIYTQNINSPDPNITGALSAILPMTISISDKNNNRLQFTLLINPESMNHGKTSSVNAAFTRSGFNTQLWGPNQDIIMSTGKTAAFMIDGEGLTNIGRRRSFAYQNFLSLVYAYRNNGYEFIDPTSLSRTLTRVINIIHGVEITYDNQVFMGHFNNFTIDEIAERPFLFDYNFEFVCSSLSGDYNEIRGHFTPIGFKDISRPNRRVNRIRIDQPDEIVPDIITTPDPLIDTENQVDLIRYSIGSYESGNSRNAGNYAAIGKTVKSGYYKGDHACGKYQVMSRNIPSWSLEALGFTITEEQFMSNPQYQDQIAAYRLDKSYRKYGTVEDAASVWFSGKPVKEVDPKAHDDNNTTVPEYITGVKYIYNKKKLNI